MSYYESPVNTLQKIIVIQQKKINTDIINSDVCKIILKQAIQFRTINTDSIIKSIQLIHAEKSVKYLISANY